MITETLFNAENITATSPQLVQLKQLFPNCFDTSGRFLLEKFQAEIAPQAEISKEFYAMNWLGKSYAKLLRNLPPETLLAEDVEHNTKPENADSQNVLIQGDNLEVLKHLKNAYANSVKMIYIDPPYNTGSDGFVYQDDRKFTPEQLANLANITQEEAERILNFTDKGSNSHSAWLTFMYPRLYIARELLKEDGVIFISIDDNEVAQLKLLCDEVFGEGNFVTTIHVELSATQGMKVKAAKNGNIVKNGEYILVYSKNGKNNICQNMLTDPVEYDNHYSAFLEKIDDTTFIEKPLSDVLILNEAILNELNSLGLLSKGKLPNKNISTAYKLGKLTKDFMNENAHLICRTHDSIEIEEVFSKKMTHNLVYRYKSENREYLIAKHDKGIYQKILFSDKLTVAHDFYKTYGATRIRGDWWSGFYLDMGNVSKEGDMPFENGKKPIRLIKQLVYMVSSPNDLILDFFAGSGTTAHAVMQLNAEDSGNRQFILVQLPEQTDKKSEAYKAGYQTIFDITKARIKKSAVKIRQDFPDASGDFGFKIYQTTENFNAVTDDEFNPNQAELPNLTSLTESQIQTLLTTWRVYDGAKLTEPVQAVDLGDYTAYLCDKRLYLLNEHFDSQHLLTFIEKLDNDTAFNPNRVIVFGNHMASAMQQELNQALASYGNRKNISLSLIVRN